MKKSSHLFKSNKLDKLKLQTQELLEEYNAYVFTVTKLKLEIETGKLESSPASKLADLKAKLSEASERLKQKDVLTLMDTIKKNLEQIKSSNEELYGSSFEDSPSLLKTGLTPR